LFGLASYQLYFMVILAWFYLLMPLWRHIVRHISQHPLRNLSIILILQIAFNYYSSYILTISSDNYYLNLAIQYRLSYLVLHYVFIFLLGAVCAVKYAEYEHFLTRRRSWLVYGFWGTLAGMLAYYYILLYLADYTPEAAVNTVHQLSPIGVLYTVAATLFWYASFAKTSLPIASRVLGVLGKYSFPVYLVHPLFMYYLSDFLASHALIMNAPVTILFFVLTVLLSITFGVFAHQFAHLFPRLGELFIGVKKRPVNMGTH
jgi:peptidoglycan/LPS O-acetylase OafA/YrhL